MINIGIFSKVDSGKTTLIESLLYKSGVVKELGRVDRKTSFLDTDEIERRRGITIYTKEARFEYMNRSYTLLDTPGHVDLLDEQVKVLDVIDCAILLISKSELVTDIEKDILKRLEERNIPTIIVVNKMDLVAKIGNKLEIVDFLVNNLSEKAFELNDIEGIANSNIDLMDQYLETGKIDLSEIVSKGMIYPVIFVSALKLDNIEAVLDALSLIKEKEYSESLKYDVYKVWYDNKGVRIVNLKVLGGVIKTKSKINDEKINEIRIYSGDTYKVVNELNKGEIGSLVGLKDLTYEENSFDCNGKEYRIEFPSNIDYILGYKKLEGLRDSEHNLNIYIDEETKEVRIRVLGELKLDILKEVIKKRFNLDVSFSEPTELIIEEVVEDEIIEVKRPNLNEYQEIDKSLDEIFKRTYGESKRDQELLKQNKVKEPLVKIKEVIRKPRYIVIDGYNLIHQIPELKDLFKLNINAARDALIDILSNYQGYTNINMMIVFDAYRVKGNPGQKLSQGDLKIVYTKEAEPADLYIEKFVDSEKKNFDFLIVTSDTLIQMSVFSDGANRISSSEFYLEILNKSKEIEEKIRNIKSTIDYSIGGRS